MVVHNDHSSAIQMMRSVFSRCWVIQHFPLFSLYALMYFTRRFYSIGDRSISDFSTFFKTDFIRSKNVIFSAHDFIESFISTSIQCQHFFPVLRAPRFMNRIFYYPCVNNCNTTDDKSNHFNCTVQAIWYSFTKRFQTNGTKLNQNEKLVSNSFVMFDDTLKVKPIKLNEFDAYKDGFSFLGIVSIRTETLGTCFQHFVMWQSENII